MLVSADGPLLLHSQLIHEIIPHLLFNIFFQACEKYCQSFYKNIPSLQFMLVVLKLLRNFYAMSLNLV